MRNGPYELSVLAVASESVSPGAADDLAAGNEGQAPLERRAYQATFPNGAVQVDSPLIEAVEPGDDVQWLWPGRIPRGIVSPEIEGDEEGREKSFVALATSSPASMLKLGSGPMDRQPWIPRLPRMLREHRSPSFRNPRS